MRRLLPILAVVTTMACEETDIGKECTGMVIPNEGGATAEGDVKRAEGSEIVEYNTAFPCHTTVCVATLGRPGYCSQECREDARGAVAARCSRCMGALVYSGQHKAASSLARVSGELFGIRVGARSLTSEAPRWRGGSLLCGGVYEAARSPSSVVRESRGIGMGFAHQSGTPRASRVVSAKRSSSSTNSASLTPSLAATVELSVLASGETRA